MTELMPTLYKKTSTGATQIWRREIDGARYRSVSGQIDGAQVEAAWTEGQMVRRDGPYKNGRSFDLLKRKTFVDQEFTVISVDEGIGNRAGMAGFITYELGDGRTFKSGIKGNWEYATQLLKDADKYVGGEGTVRFFQFTPDGIPRFPVTVALYEGKRDL